MKSSYITYNENCTLRSKTKILNMAL